MRGNPVRKQVLVIAAAALVVAAGAVAWYLLTQRHVGSILEQGQRTNVLLAGDDEQGGVDAMMVLSLTSEDLVFLSVPAAVRVKGPEGALAPASDVFATFGGAAAARAISDLLGIDVPFFLAAERRVLADWIDSFGGITVALEETAIYADESVDPPMRVEIRAEERAMTGAEAVAFAASPSLPGDVGLAARQEALLHAALAQGVRGQATRTLRSVVREGFSSIDTNCPMDDLFEVA